MRRVTVPILGQTQNSKSLIINCQRSINLIPKPEMPGAKGPLSLVSSPGLNPTDSMSAGPCRSNGVKWRGYCYMVIGTSLVKIDSTGNGTSVGTISTPASRCVIAKGLYHIMVVDGTYGYVWDNSTFTQINDADFSTNPTHVAYLNGYFIVNKNATTSDEYQMSDLDDPTAWAALDVGRATGTPDSVFALDSNNKDLYLFGNEASEVHYYSGNADFPFEPYPGGGIQVGLHAPYSLVRSVYGLVGLYTNEEGDAVIGRLNGLQFTPISDGDLNYQINNLSLTTDGIGSIFRLYGRTYYVISFSGSDKTFAVDLADGYVWEPKTYELGRWRVAGIGKVGSILVAGDYSSGTIYKIDPSIYTDNSALIERERITQVIHAEGKLITHHRIELDMETGVGLQSGQGSEPLVELSFSDDKGRTWSNPISKNFGAVGKYTTRVVFDGLGDSYDRRYRIRVTDPVNTVLAGALGDFEIREDG